MAGILILIDSMMLRKLRFGILDSHGQLLLMWLLPGKQKHSWQNALAKLG
jgi:hypothetical protein